MKHIRERQIRRQRGKLFWKETQAAVAELRAAGLNASFERWRYCGNVVDVFDGSGHYWLSVTFDPDGSNQTNWLAQELRRALKLYQNQLAQSA